LILRLFLLWLLDFEVFYDLDHNPPIRHVNLNLVAIALNPMESLNKQELSQQTRHLRLNEQPGQHRHQVISTDLLAKTELECVLNDLDCLANLY